MQFDRIPPSIDPPVPALCGGNAGTGGGTVGRKVGKDANGVGGEYDGAPSEVAD